MERSLALGMLLAAGDRVAVRLGGGEGGCTSGRPCTAWLMNQIREGPLQRRMYHLARSQE